MSEPLGALLTICLTVSPQIVLTEHERTALFTEAQQVWQSHAVAVRQGQADDCDRLIVVKSDAEARPEDVAHDAALGWVPFVAGRARRLVFLRVGRAQALIGAMSPGTRPEGLTRLLVAKFLGRILAHELGHVLLNSTQHPSKGLMRAHFRARDVLNAPLSTYTLDVGEQALVFADTPAVLQVARR